MSAPGRGPRGTAPPVRVRRVIAEPAEGGGFWAMDENGACRWFEQPEALLHWIRGRDRAAAARGRSTITQIEWRDMPEGFVPPA